MSKIENRLKRLLSHLDILERLESVWSLSKAKILEAAFQDLLGTPLKTKELLKIKLGVRHCLATLSGIVVGREEKLMTKENVKVHLKKLVPVVQSLRAVLEELEISNDGEESSVPVVQPTSKKQITIRPGCGELSPEAQTKLTRAITDEDTGEVRTIQVDFAEQELSTMERLWEESEFIRITKEHTLQEWNGKHTQKMNTAMDKYAEQVSGLKTLLVNQQAILQKAPVVPTARVVGIFKVKALGRAGVSVVDISGCSVFEDQIILSINTDYVTQTFTDTAEYKSEYRNYRKKLEVYTNKFRPIQQADTYIKSLEEEIEWFDIKPVEGYGEDKERAEETRALRITWLNKEIEQCRNKNELRKKELAEEYIAYATLEEQFREFSKAGRIKHKGNMGDYSTRNFEVAEKCLEEINKKLRPADQLVFVTNQGVRHGYITNYWVMKDVQMGAWAGELCFSKAKLQISDWSLPLRSVSEDSRLFFEQLGFQQEVTTFVLNRYRKEFTKKSTEKKLIEFFAQRRVKYEGYYAQVFERIWKDAPIVLGMEEIKTVVNIPVVSAEVKTGLQRLKEKMNTAMDK